MLSMGPVTIRSQNGQREWEKEGEEGSDSECDLARKLCFFGIYSIEEGSCDMIRKYGLFRLLRINSSYLIVKFSILCFTAIRLYGYTAISYKL